MGWSCTFLRTAALAASGAPLANPQPRQRRCTTQQVLCTRTNRWKLSRLLPAAFVHWNVRLAWFASAHRHRALQPVFAAVAFIIIFKPIPWPTDTIQDSLVQQLVVSFTLSPSLSRVAVVTAQALLSASLVLSFCRQSTGRYFPPPSTANLTTPTVISNLSFLPPQS